MHNIAAALGLVLITALNGATGAQNTPEPPAGAVYGVEQGRYDTVNDNGLTEIRTTFYWTDWGRTRAQHQVILTPSSGKETRILLLFTPEAITEVNLETGEAKQRPFPPAARIAEQSAAEGELLSVAMYRLNGFAASGETRMIDGRPCAVYRRLLTGDPDGPLSEACLWRGIAIETMARLYGRARVMTAMDIDIGPVDPAVFSLPEDITYVDSVR